MRLLSPLWLLALLLVPVVVGVDLRRPWAGGRAAGVALRAVLLSLLVAAAAQPVRDRPVPDAAAIRVVDRSASAAPAAETDGLTVDFAATASLVGAPEDREASDLDAALALALARLPADRPGSVRVESDGGAAPSAAALEQARSSARAIDVASQPPIDAPRLLSIDLDRSRTSRGATVTGTLRAHGGSGGLAGPVLLTLGTAELPPVPLEAAADTAVSVPLTFDVPPDTADGLVRLTATAGDDTVSTGLVIARPPRVLLVGGERLSGAAIGAALRADGLAVQRTSPSSAPADLSDIDLVLLADAPAGGPGAKDRQALAPGFLTALDPWVRSGGGLLVVGGPHAYELGGYPQSPLGALLPVSAEPPGQERELNVDMVIALDKSASMAAPVSGGTPMRGISQRMTGGRASGSKIVLVSGAAAASIRRLRDQDRIGVLAVDAEARWTVRPTSAAARGDIAARMGRIKAGGGGIFLTNALVMAREPLLESDAAVRHLLLFADTADVSQKEGPGPDGEPTTADALVDELAESGVTISIIGVGSRNDRDVPYLQAMADRTGGRFRLTSDFKRLKALFVQETEKVVARSLEEDTLARVRAVRTHPALAGIAVASAPPLQGWNRLEARPRSRTLLATDTGAPVMVAWNLGLGEVVAVGTDAGERWAVGWPRWSGHGPLWTRLARSLARDPDEAGSGLDIAVDGWTLTLTRRDANGLTPSGAPLTATLDSDAGSVDLPLTLQAPGTWTAPLDVAPEARWTLSVADGSGTPLGRREGIAPPSPERLPVDPDALADLAQPGGEQPTRLQTVPLGPWLLLLALLLLPVDALLRRGARVVT